MIEWNKLLFGKQAKELGFDKVSGCAVTLSG